MSRFQFIRNAIDQVRQRFSRPQTKQPQRSNQPSQFKPAATQQVADPQQNSQRHQALAREHGKALRENTISAQDTKGPTTPMPRQQAKPESTYDPHNSPAPGYQGRGRQKGLER